MNRPGRNPSETEYYPTLLPAVDRGWGPLLLSQSLDESGTDSEAFQKAYEGLRPAKETEVSVCLSRHTSPSGPRFLRSYSPSPVYNRGSLKPSSPCVLSKRGAEVEENVRGTEVRERWGFDPLPLYL